MKDMPKFVEAFRLLSKVAHCDSAIVYDLGAESKAFRLEWEGWVNEENLGKVEQEARRPLADIVRDGMGEYCLPDITGQGKHCFLAKTKAGGTKLFVKLSVCMDKQWLYTVQVLLAAYSARDGGPSEARATFYPFD